MSIVRAATQTEIKDISNKIDFAFNDRSNGVVIEDDRGEVGAMAIYDRWTKSSVEMHAYSKSPKFIFNPDFCKAIFTYPFVQQNKMLAYAVTPCDNSASIAIARFLGFKEVYRIKDGWNLGTDMVIQELRRASCRFLDRTILDVKGISVSN